MKTSAIAIAALAAICSGWDGTGHHYRPQDVSASRVLRRP